MNTQLSYPIARPYPFGTWFTYGTWAGFSLLLVFFSIFNLATNGYDMDTIYTDKPQKIIDAKHWFNSWAFTWGNSKLQPLCQKIEIPVGYQFMTSNQGFTYTVKSVFAQEDSTKVVQPKQMSSITYINNPLGNCQVESISMHFEKDDDSLGDWANWWSWASSYATATASCDILNATTTSNITFDVTYHIADTVYDCVAVDDYTTHAPVWWGVRLLDNYFIGTLWVISETSPYYDTKKTFTSADITFTPGETEDMTSFNLFDATCGFLESNGGLHHLPNNVDIWNNKTFELSRPMTEAFFFAKVLRSLILVDLGNPAPPNVLSDPKLPQYILNGTDDFNRDFVAPLNNGTNHLDWWKVGAIAPPNVMAKTNTTAVLMNETYNKFSSEMGPLGTTNTTNATISAQYTCSTPKGKSIPAMILATLVADIALLQGAYTNFSFLALRVAMHKNPKAMNCPGCMSQDLEMNNLAPESAGLLGLKKTLSVNAARSRDSDDYGLLENGSRSGD